MVICIAEDRKSCEVAVKLVLLSLTKHCGQVPVELFYPPADDGFSAWLHKCPQVRLNKEPVPGAYSWNVKPQALLSLLQRGHDDVVWIDSDIIVTRDFRPLLAGLDSSSIVLAEEGSTSGYADPDAFRARKWGFQVGRVLPFTANTAVMRVTHLHIELLQCWRTLLESELYKHVQRLDWGQRPAHLFGDQDVLTALLSSCKYSGIPIRFLKRGRDIVQYWGIHGYTCAERFGNLIHGLPTFVHSQIYKPWSPSNIQPGNLDRFREYFYALYLDLSPYTLMARRFKRDLNDDVNWMKPRFLSGAVLRAAGFWYPPLVGLPIAAIADSIRLAKQLGRDGGELVREG